MASNGWKNWKASVSAEGESQGIRALKMAQEYSKNDNISESLRSKWKRLANAMEVLVAAEE